MSPEELRASLSQPQSAVEDRFACFIDLVCNPNEEPSHRVDPVSDPEIDRWEDARVQMSDEEWKAYLDDTLNLAMNQCPRCFAPVTSHSIGGSKIVTAFNCTRFMDHSFVRAVPLQMERG